ncbi:MAG: sulfurtransferase TusA family protein [Thiohalomonadaceae bacterium]
MVMRWWRNWLMERPQGSVSDTPVTVSLPNGCVTVARTLDCLGAACPRPQLLTMKVMEQLREGEVIELLSDNPATVETLPALMFAVCGTHLATVKDVDHWRVYMRKGL